jgi:aryl-alcohol dehydrogenase-like predicted oxidoreductase
VAINSWAPVAGGLLTGLYKRGVPPPPGSRYADPRIAVPYARRLNPHVFDVLDVLEPIAEGKSCSVAQLALAWVIRQPGVTSAVTGPETPSDIADSLGALELQFAAADFAAIDEVAPPTQMLSPFYVSDLNQFRPHPNRL